MNYVDIAGVAELQNGQMKPFQAGDHKVLVARINDKYYAVDRRCPHLGGDLATGALDGTVITCPLHHSQFDVTDGHVIRWTDWTGIKLNLVKIIRSPRALKTYYVKIENDRLMVEVDRSL